MIDKLGMIQDVSSFNPIAALELGVGDRKRNPDAIGVDIIDHASVDVVGDILSVLQMLPDECVNSIFSEHVFEHLPDLDLILNEISRVLVFEGDLTIIVPHFSNPFFYSDPTHRNFFGLYTFSYFCSESLFLRRVPSYARIENLRLIGVNIIFKTFRPRYLTYAWRKVLQFFFNLTNYTKEVYEDSFSRFVSCYEIEYRIIKRELKR